MSFKRIYSQGEQLKDAGDILLPLLMSGMKDVTELDFEFNISLFNK